QRFLLKKCHGAVKNFPPANLTKISEPKVIIIEKLVTLQPNPHKNDKRRAARKAQQYRMIRSDNRSKIGQKNNGDCIGAIAITFMCHDDVSVLSAYRLNL
ncbi:hypothetical protein, partial [uncultured Muribaculum sp.]|uniref:hypothetical protein n=1 Tax=uncultured Muribaculum sp. TaxID=1918613 RepID=UPI00271219BB